MRLNRDLKARVDELETLFETIPIGIAIAEDSRVRRIRANPALERLLETPPGSNTSLTAPEDQRPGHFHFRRDGRDVAPDDLPMQVAAREGRPVVGETLEVIFADGRTRMIHGNAAPLFDEEGRPRGAVGAFMDVTEWRRVEAALADSEERLRLAVQATGLGLFDRDVVSQTSCAGRRAPRRSSGSRPMTRSPSSASSPCSTRTTATGSRVRHRTRPGPRGRRRL